MKVSRRGGSLRCAWEKLGGERRQIGNLGGASEFSTRLPSKSRFLFHLLRAPTTGAPPATSTPSSLRRFPSRSLPAVTCATCLTTVEVTMTVALTSKSILLQHHCIGRIFSHCSLRYCCILLSEWPFVPGMGYTGILCRRRLKRSTV